MPNSENDSSSISEDEVVKAARNFWKIYLALSEDLLKFINQEDIDTFTDIVSQRDSLIKKIEELPSNDYRKLDEFKVIAEKIKKLDRETMYKARSWLNKSRRQNSMVRSYDLGTALAMKQSTNFNQKY